MPRAKKEEADKVAVQTPVTEQQDPQPSERVDRVNRIFTPDEEAIPDVFPPLEDGGFDVTPDGLSPEVEYMKPDKNVDGFRPMSETSVNLLNDRASYDKNHNLIFNVRTDTVQTYDPKTQSWRTSVKTERNRSHLTRWLKDGIFDHPMK